MNKNYNTNNSRWEDNISILMNNNVEYVYLTTYTPNDIITEQIDSNYNKYVDFILSIKATPVNPVLLSGISTTLIIKLDDKSEFIVSLMSNYAIIDNKYYFKIDNYSEISKNYHDLFDINL